MHLMRIAFAVFVCVVCSVISLRGLQADVKSSAAGHFLLSIEKEVKAPSDVVWRHLLDLGSWWNSSHTWSGDSKNLTLTTKPGGGFDETLPNGGFVRHMAVIYCDPEKKLRLSGVLGPLQEEALTGTMTITLTKKDSSTVITTTYKVAGHMDAGLDKIAPLVDKVLTEQITRLAAVIDSEAAPKP